MGPATKTRAQDFIRQWRPTAPARASTFAAEMYYSPEVYRLEQERVFGGRTWVGVGGLHQLSGPGSYFTTVVAGQPILVLRNRQGELRAFFNVCSHRGGPLAREAGVLPGGLQCQYHGWTFSLEGELQKARDFEGVEDFDPGAFGLRTLRVDVWEHSVFVSLSPDSPSLAEYLEDLPQRVRPWGLGDKVYAFTQEYQMEANWKAVWETASEGYHLPIVHPQAPYNPKSYEEIPGTNYALTISPPWNPRLEHTLKFEDEVLVVSLYPNFFLTLMPDYFNAVYVIPEGIDRTTFRLDFYFPPGRLEDRTSTEEVRAAWDELNLQDVRINEEVQRGLRSMGYDQGRLSVRWEKSLHHFHTLLMKHILGEL